MRTLGLFSSGIEEIPNLKCFLPEYEQIFFHSWRAEPDAVAGWGLRPTANRARDYAQANNIPYIALEDGFLRSLELGVHGAPPVSMVVDDLGVYYDATRVSRLEKILETGSAGSGELFVEAREVMAAMREHNIGKYNAAPEADPKRLDLGNRPLVLVVDQTRGDMSVTSGLGDAETFKIMLDAAVQEHPDADVRVKIHPDVWAGKRQGYLLEASKRKNVPVIAKDVGWMSLVRHASQVYVVTSQAGMESLIQGIPVTCFGMPYYAGWGLTDDRMSCTRRTRRVSLEELFAAAYLKYARYVAPVSGQKCSAMTAVQHLIRCKALNDANRGHTEVIGIERWKRPHVRPFLASTGGSIRFAVTARGAIKRAARNRGRIVVWKAVEPEGLAVEAERKGIELIGMEDGFLRSSGLGADVIPASSLVMDRSGIYFNPARESDLERMLSKMDFPQALIERARRLRQSIVAKGVTKYNVGTKKAADLLHDFPTSGSRRRILVPGQVENDASIRSGATGINTNAGLLEAVRRNNLDAFIIYKPHPDIEAGYRLGAVKERDARRHADLVVSSLSSVLLLDLVEEVHTMTSLLGFEALLRGKRVVTYGVPFYAGWGLTQDQVEIPRRARRLNLDELVACALILYPTYYDWKSGQPCTPEALLERLAEASDALPPGRTVRWFRFIWGWLKG